MTYEYRDSDDFRASRAKTARRRYWANPEKGRERSQAYRQKKKAQKSHCVECGIDLSDAEIEAGASFCYGCVEWYATQPC
jgi:hypothetical protein